MIGNANIPNVQKRFTKIRDHTIEEELPNIAENIQNLSKRSVS